MTDKRLKTVADLKGKTIGITGIVRDGRIYGGRISAPTRDG